MATNLAIHRPALQSSTGPAPTNKDDPATEAARANDGNRETARTFHTARERGPWWQVDLGSSFLLTKLILYNADKFKERLARFTLFRSNDGIEWFPFYRKSERKIFDTHVIEPGANCLARFVRVRLDGLDFLHFRQCEIYGELPAEDLKERLLDKDVLRRNAQRAIPIGRKGHITEIEDCFVFVDGQYSHNVRTVLDNGNYEGRERKLVKDFLQKGDRVLELGTAIGVLTMTAAALVGAENVRTFDANPDIVADAQDNFLRNNLSEIRSNWGVLRNRANFKPGETVDFHIHDVFVASRLNVPSNSPGFVKTVQVPVFCLEDEIASANANVLICDIEGGEVDLFGLANLVDIRLIIMETHYQVAGEMRTDAMISKLVGDGFSVNLEASGGGVVVLRRHDWKKPQTG